MAESSTTSNVRVSCTSKYIFHVMNQFIQWAVRQSIQRAVNSSDYIIFNTLRDFRLPLRSSWELRSSWLWRWFLQPIGPIYGGLLETEDGTDRLSRNVGKNYDYSLRNNPEERRTQCHYVHHKCHMNWPGIRSDPPRCEAPNNRLSHDTSLNCR